MKKLALAFLLLASSPSHAWTQTAPLPLQSCKIHSPYGFPDSQKTLKPICRTGYLVGYDAPAKIPAYVVYTLQPQNALGCFPRTNAFVADRSVKGGAHPDDYVGTGYDKGHVAPDGDLSWDQQVEYESFLMTNMLPQAGGFNRGIWKLLETSVRGWAVQLNAPFTIYAGGIYNASDKNIGAGVTVPHGFYKIVINNKTKEIAGWMFKHKSYDPNISKVRAPIATIEKAAGVKFAYPADAKELPAGKEWPVDFGALTKAKRAKCK